MRKVVDRARLQDFMKALSAQAKVEGRVYLTGGATAVLSGWRTSTIDIDLKFVPEQDSLFRAIPKLKESLQLNIELASPDDFIPPLKGWQERSPLVAQEGRIAFHNYDFYAQALSKIERGHERDVGDVDEMFKRHLVEPEALRRSFDEIEPRLYRYPAIDPGAFRRALDEAIAKNARK